MEDNLAVKIREIELKIERLQEHDKYDRMKLDEVVLTVADIRVSIKEISTDVKDIPEKMTEVEKKLIEKSAFDKIVNAIILIVLGIIISHLFKGQFSARKEDEKNISQIESRNFF